jgi:CDGSH-type Zn-finger protein
LIFSQENNGKVEIMDKPRIAQRKPAILELEPGTYYWCACGRSQSQPFCDGSHKVTDITPQEFEITEKKRVALCQCKHSHNMPYCDGTHKTLPPDLPE